MEVFPVKYTLLRLNIYREAQSESVALVVSTM